MTNREAAAAASGQVLASRFNEIQILLVKRNGQTRRVEAIQACLNELLRFAFGVKRNAGGENTVFLCGLAGDLRLKEADDFLYLN